MNNRSFLSKVAEAILRKTKPDYMNSYEKVNDFLKSNQEKEFKTIFHTDKFNDTDIVSFGNGYDNSNIILYMHGGAYVNQMNIQHTAFCYILSKILKTRIIAPVYPLTPEHDCKDTYELITRLYSKIRDEYSNVTLMGDSAGGGFILSFCQFINKRQLRQADKIVVFSPWMDVSMKRQINDENDPILGNVGLRQIGKKWAGDLKTTDYRVSPLYGDDYNMPNTMIFVGTNEIFYEDIMEYHEKLVNNGVDAELIVGEGLFHIYPLFPIPEAISALKKIKKEFEN